jgi:hypothetical protein
MLTITPTALDVNDLRSRLRRRIRWSTIGCLVMIALTVTSALVLARVDASLSAEQSKFDHYRAEIVAISGSSDDDSSSGSATLTFDEGPRHRMADVHLDDTRSFSVGPATALVDPRDDSFVTLPGENYFRAGPALVTLFVGGFGLVALGCLLFALHNRRINRVLSKSSWQSVSGFGATVKSGDSTRGLVYLPDLDGGTFWIGRSAMGVARFRASVAIDSKRKLVMRAADGKRLLLAQEAHAEGTWMRAHVGSASRHGTGIVYELKSDDGDLVYWLDVDAFDECQIDILTRCSEIELLPGPCRAHVVRVPPFGVVGLAVPTVKKKPKKVMKPKSRSMARPISRQVSRR